MNPDHGSRPEGEPPGPAEPADAPTVTDDDALLRRVREGDLAAFERLVDRKRDRAFRLARHVVGDDEDAKDVVQLAFIRVWRRIRRYREGVGFDPWFHRIVMNLAIDFRRRRATRSRGLRALGSDRRAAVPERADLPGPLRREEVGRIYEDLARGLPPRQRVIFALKAIEGMSTDEVARTLGLRPSTVRNHLFQARRSLRGELERRYPEYMPVPRKEGDES